MRKIFVDEPCGEIFTLKGDDNAHLTVVLRAAVDDEVVLCRGDGSDYIYRVEKIGRDASRLVLSDKVGLPPPGPSVTLFMPLLKGDKNELVAQKATELGVFRIIPLTTRFTQIRSESFRRERVLKIIKEAGQQCGASALPVLEEPIALREAADRLKDFEKVIFPYERERLLDIRSAVGGLKNLKKAAVIVGGEGGFAQDEADELRARGALSVTMGPRILRAETACIAALALVVCAMGGMS